MNNMAILYMEVRLTMGLAMYLLEVANYGVTEDKLSGETLRVGVLLADSEAGRKKGAGISLVGVSPWFRSCRICRSKALPSSRVSLNAQHFWAQVEASSHSLHLK